MSSSRWTPQDLADYRAKRGLKLEIVDDEPKLIVVPGEPVAKPRQTRSDKWKERPCVIRYREWADKARASAGAIPLAAECAEIVAYLPLPSSWSQKKRSAMSGQPHRVKPDVDNILKSVLDALLKRDQAIYKVSGTKFWEDANGPRVEITLY